VFALKPTSDLLRASATFSQPPPPFPREQALLLVDMLTSSHTAPLFGTLKSNSDQVHVINRVNGGMSLTMLIN
jgi:hypothetical protein